MTQDFEFTSHDQREHNKFNLEVFAISKGTEFTHSIDKIMKELELENKKNETEFDNWDTMEEREPERYRELKEQAERYEIHIDVQKYGYIEDIFFNNEEDLLRA